VCAQIVIVSSVAARRGVPFLGPYAATKAAQLSIAEALRIELRPYRIAVTSVHPIVTKTEFGDVAEQGGVKLPRGISMSQTVDHVARAMIRGIERPRPEVWPHRPTRLALVFATLAPRVVDHFMKKYMREIERVNPSGPTS
jgi:short-subunit dehydrogenase